MFDRVGDLIYLSNKERRFKTQIVREVDESIEMGKKALDGLACYVVKVDNLENETKELRKENDELKEVVKSLRERVEKLELEPPNRKDGISGYSTIIIS